MKFVVRTKTSPDAFVSHNGDHQLKWTEHRDLAKRMGHAEMESLLKFLNGGQASPGYEAVLSE